MGCENVTTERQILTDLIPDGLDELNTTATQLLEAKYRNPHKECILGHFLDPSTARKAIITDMDLIYRILDANKEIPSFLEAGPRLLLAFKRGDLRVAIVTTGGVAPGLNTIVHSIVARHSDTYGSLLGNGRIYGVYDSFIGLRSRTQEYLELNPQITAEWLTRGGCELGAMRTSTDDGELEKLAYDCARNLKARRIDICYIIGGDGSMQVAYYINYFLRSIEKEEEVENKKRRTTKTLIVGLPKTMDNDLLWVWNSFGFNTAVEQASEFVRTMCCEARATRRICITELFGAESGYVAAHTALASGHVDLVMIPEELSGLDSEDCLKLIERCVIRLEDIILNRGMKPYAVVVLAEGFGKCLAEKDVVLNGEEVNGENFIELFKEYIKNKNIRTTADDEMGVFTVYPRHYIRAVPANYYDQIYCKRLGDFAVDSALAGYTNFMISRWKNDHVMVPLELVIKGKKGILTSGMFWKQVVASTGQTNVYV